MNGDKITITFVDNCNNKIGTLQMNGTLQNDYTSETGRVYVTGYNNENKNNIQIKVEIDIW